MCMLFRVSVGVSYSFSQLNLNDSDDNAIGKACKSGFSPFQNKIIDNRTDTATRS